MAKKKTKKQAVEEYKQLIFSTQYNTYIGIDIGTTITGVSVLHQNDEPLLQQIRPTNLLAIEKIHYIVNNINEIVYKYNAKECFVAIEVPFGVQGNGRILLELLGAIKDNIFNRDIHIITIPQMSLKKFATNNGKAEKSQMVLKAFKEYGIDVDNEDLVDAFWLSKIAYAIVNGCEEKFRQESITKILSSFTI